MRTELDALRSMQRYVAQALPEPWEVLLEVEAGDPPARPFAVVSADGDGDTLGLLAAPEVRLPVTVQAYPAPGATRALSLEAAMAVRESLWDLVHLGAAPGRPMLLPLFAYEGAPEVQHVELVGATGGTFALTFDGEATAPIDVKAQPTHVRWALEALASVDVGTVEVVGRVGGPWAVRFVRARTGVPQPLLEGDASGLTGQAPEVFVARLQAGSPDPYRRPVDFARIEQPTRGIMRDPADPQQRTVTLGCRLTWGRRGRLPSAEMILTSIRARTSCPF